MTPTPPLEKDEKWNDRTLRLIGAEGAAALSHASVLVVGVGGVGGYAAEMLARSGVGKLTLLDADDVSVSNINRQLIATSATVGMPKTELFKERFRLINPEIEVTSLQQYLTPENVAEVMSAGFDFVVDAIDTVAPKVALILHCLRNKVPLISSMGAGGRIDPTKIGYFDISETREDGLARAVRQRLRKEGIRGGVKVVASTEPPASRSIIPLDLPNKKSSFGTLATIPAIFGIMMANHVIRKLIQF